MRHIGRSDIRHQLALQSERESAPLQPPVGRRPKVHQLSLSSLHRQHSERYNERLKQIERLEKDGRIFVIRPSETIAVSRLEKNPAKIQAAYDLGCRDAQALWPSLDCYLQSFMR